MITITKVKYFLVIILLIIFTYLFGYPSIIKLNEKDTIMIEKSVPFDASIPPLILLNSERNGTKKSSGLKNFISAKNFITVFTNLTEDEDSLKKFFYDESYTIEDIIEEAKDAEMRDLVNGNLWTHDIGRSIFRKK